MKLTLRDKAPFITPEMKREYGILFEKDLNIWKRSKLKMKFLIFENCKLLTEFFEGLGDSPTTMFDQGAQAAGMVCNFMTVHYPEGDEKRAYMTADGKYFAWMGISKGYLSMEIICHESVHAGFSYAKRVGRIPFGNVVEDFDEELVCYPSGRVAQVVYDEVTKHPELL